jgi:hypothetical protein
VANWFTKKLNGKGADPASLAAALDDLIAQRAQVLRKIDGLNEQRVQALKDRDFKGAAALERERDAALKELEGLELSEPEIREQLANAERAARDARWREIRGAALAAATEAVDAGALAARKSLSYVALVEQARREGFDREIMALPNLPTVNGNLVCANDLLERAKSAIEAAGNRDRAQPKAAAPPSAPIRRQILPHDRKPHGEAHHAVSSGTTDLPRQPPPPRAADDLSELKPGDARVKFLSAGYSPADDQPQCSHGQIVVMSLGAARAAEQRGKVQVLEPKEITQ